MATARAFPIAQAPSKPQLWGTLLFNSAIGIVFMFINFPKLLQSLTLSFAGDKGIGAALLNLSQETQTLIASLVGANPQNTFQTLISYSFLGLWIYIIVLTIFSLRHRDPMLLLLGILGLVIGFFALHIISWIAVVIVWVIWLLSTILGFIANIFTFILSFLVLYRSWIFLIVGFLAVLYLTYVFRNYIVRILVALLLISGIIYLINRFFPNLWQQIVYIVGVVVDFIMDVWDRLIAPILAFLIAVIGYVFLFCLIVIGIFGVLSTLGHLVVDQIRAAWHAGSGRKGILLCAFGIGTAIALIFLTSVANPTLATSINTGWTASWQVLDSVVGTKMATAGLAQAHLTDGFAGLMISSVHEFAFQNLTATNAPLYDTFLLLTVLCISYIGIMRGLFSTVLDSEEFSSIVFVPYEYFAIFGGLIVQV